MSGKHMQQVFEEADCLYTLEQVKAEIARLAGEICQAYAAENPVVLVVMNGGLVFAGQLLPLLDFPLQIDYLHASRYGHETQGTHLQWRVEPTTDLHDRQVLILDDILDVGKTLQDIVAFCKERGARTVKTAVLTEKLHQRKADSRFTADFCGLQLVDRFVFGFGMDYQGYWRNAPGIYAVKGL